MVYVRLIQQVLDLPAFLLGVFFLYWSVPLSVLQGRIQFWNLRGKRDDAYGWARGLQALFAITVLQLPGEGLYKGEGVVYLANHRCWADFFVDVLMTDGRAQMLSRMAVLLAFPAFMCCVWALKAVVLFKRGAKINKDKFNDMIDRKMRESPIQGLIVYPEGHRSTKTDSLPLKRGMLHFCYERKHSVQVVMSANKEAVLSEKDLRSRLRQAILVGYGKPVHPGDYPSFEAFLAGVQKSWDAEWLRVYSADWRTASLKRALDSRVHNYPTSIKLWQIALQSAACIFFFTTLYWGFQLFLLLMSLFGTHKALASALLVGWWSISLARASVPVKLPLAPQPSPAS